MIYKSIIKKMLRRLSEILTFPKAWYNRNLTRRLFLGEESFANTGDEGI
jgi:hypothetical protein